MPSNETLDVFGIRGAPAPFSDAPLTVSSTDFSNRSRIERMPHFRMGFTPSSGKELQAEYFVPRHHALDAILAVQRLGRQIGPHLFISEIRTIHEDNLWMSPCYKQPSVTIHFTWKQEWEAVSKLLPVIEKELTPFNPKPHMGKLFTMSPSKLAGRYKKINDFKKMVAQYDPHGKFRNDFLEKNIYGGQMP